MCRGRIQWWQSITFSAAPVAGWTSSGDEGSTASAGRFLQWILCDCPTSGPGRWWCPGTWMTPLQSQCCSWWCMGGEQGVPLREHRAASKTLGERHQRCPALNHKCNQSKLTARRQVRVTSRPGCLKARDVQPAPASRNEAKLSVCVSHCL